MGKVSAMPRYHIENVPQSLRQLANRIEHGEIIGSRMVVCIHVEEDDSVDYIAIGPDPFNRTMASGIVSRVLKELT